MYDWDDEIETRSCNLCGADYKPLWSWHTVCNDCVDDYKYDIVVASMIGQDYPEMARINALYYWYFSEDEINELLYRAIKADHGRKAIDFTAFYDEDRERLAEAVKHINGGYVNV